MSQRSNILHNLINSPSVYKLIQKFMLGTSFRKNYRKNIKKNVNVLDIGWWPCRNNRLYADCNYYGYDIDEKINTLR